MNDPTFGLAAAAAASGWHLSGTTRIYAHVAHPSAHVRTPQVFNAEFARRGIDAAVLSVDVEPSRLPALIEGFRGWRNLAGIGVTMPHKETIGALLDTLTPRARRVGAVNVIRRDPDGTLHGDNLDGLGFTTGLEDAGHSLSGRQVLVVGAGGAARAIAFALLDAGVARLGIANRTPKRARDLVAELSAVGSDSVIEFSAADGAGYDVIVNATSLGLHPGDSFPVPIDTVERTAVVAEIVMTPAVTAWMAAAAAAGIATHPGLPMLSAQLQLVLDELGLTSPASSLSTGSPS